jgi:GTP cyclohydrolase IA
VADYRDHQRALDLVGMPRITDSERTEWHVEQLLKALVPGFSLDKEHHRGTPARYVKMMKELCEPEEFTFTTFPTDTNDMVVLGPLPFYTLCAHHVIPFHGSAFVGYVPNGHIAGLSKFARAVKYVAKGLWDQESLTSALADFLEKNLHEPKGVAVVMEAEHLCMAMRGVETPGVITTTSVMRGVFSDHARTAKAEFTQWIQPRRSHK